MVQQRQLPPRTTVPAVYRGVYEQPAAEPEPESTEPTLADIAEAIGSEIAGKNWTEPAAQLAADFFRQLAYRLQIVESKVESRLGGIEHAIVDHLAAHENLRRRSLAIGDAPQVEAPPKTAVAVSTKNQADADDTAP